MSKDPLHGITLQQIIEKLVAFYGFDTLGELIKIKCFTSPGSASLRVVDNSGMLPASLYTGIRK